MPSLTADVIVYRGGEAVHVEPVGHGAMFVGRSPDNDLTLSDAKVSGHHLVFHFTE